MEALLGIHGGETEEGMRQGFEGGDCLSSHVLLFQEVGLRFGEFVERRLSRQAISGLDGIGKVGKVNTYSEKRENVNPYDMRPYPLS